MDVIKKIRTHGGNVAAQPLKAYGSEYRNLLRLGAPVLVTQIGIILVSFADTMMIGAYGDRVSGLAAAAFVNSLFMIPIVMLLGFAAGTTPLIGALFSRKSDFELGRTGRAALQVNVIVSMAFTLLMGVLYFFIDRFGQPEELLPLIRPYYLLMLLNLIPTALFNCCQQISNGVTDTATPMWVILGANLLNVAGNYILIFGHFGAPEMGLAGAGVSTVIARVAGAVVMLLLVRNMRRFRPYAEGLRTPGTPGVIRRKVWTTSYPVMIQSGVECSLWTFGAIVSGWYGKVQLASYQVVNTVAQLGFMIFMSFGVAISIRVANYTGLGDRRAVRRIASAGLHINLLLATLASACFYFFGHDLATLFTDDARVLAAAALLIAPLILYQYGDAIQLTFANALRGTSHVKPLLWISLGSYLLLGVPLLLWLAVGMDMRNVGVYYSFSGALFAAAMLLFLSFRRAARFIGPKD
ncbi:MAG: MATE family efflux transporter [Muribaculaceae bacterium]|nr:MATE family efflux transporter [Muribaculaceae bacterium]